MTQGTDEGMLLLNGAMQIATGRAIIPGNTVTQSGVLLLVGEARGGPGRPLPARRHAVGVHPGAAQHRDGRGKPDCARQRRLYRRFDDRKLSHRDGSDEPLIG